MDLGVGEMGFIFCGKHHLLVTRTQVSDSGHMDPHVSFTLNLLRTNSQNLTNFVYALIFTRSVMALN